MKLKAYGDRGVLLTELEDGQRANLIQRLEGCLPEGCEEFVVGYDSILLVGQGMIQSDVARSTLRLRSGLETGSGSSTGIASRQAGSDGKPSAPTSLPILKVDVVYNGADLESVAKACDLTVDRVIELHCAPIYTVRMMGFSPGFPYLEGLDSRLHLPRRASPRNHIEPGTVAIGGSHAGIYSVASPGGWHLLGHTDLPLFNLEAASQANPSPEEVFALSLGDRIRFQVKEGA